MAQLIDLKILTLPYGFDILIYVGRFISACFSFIRRIFMGITGFIKLIMAFFLSLTQIFTPVDALIQSGGEDAYFSEWSASDVFDEEDYIELEKTPGEDFVVLNLTDIQLSDTRMYDKHGTYSMELITKLIEDNDPDLITLSGDNAWDSVAYLDTIEFIDSFGIPWAPVMGNHDGEGCLSEFWVAYNLIAAENCLFQFGPKDMGYGNYIINITENGKIIHTFFMMDTHDSAEFTLEDGTVIEGYDHLWDNQQEWYKWAVEGIKDLAGHTVESTVVIHIPVFEIHDAWNSVSIESEEEFGSINPAYSLIASGKKGEESCPAPVNNGFFSLCKELGSTKNIIMGHDHRNDFSVLYEGIRLTYGVKSGFGSYWREDMIGGTTINVNSLGNASIEQHYYSLIENGWLISYE